MTSNFTRVGAKARHAAQRLGVDTSLIEAGTGLGGAVTSADVERAARERSAAPRPAVARPAGTEPTSPPAHERTAPMTTPSRPVEAAARPRPTLVIEKRTHWRPLTTLAGQKHRESPPLVRIDVYAANPLVDELRAADPRQYARSLAQFGAAPTLFNAGDLPLYLASGVDVSLLNQLPWIARPAAARATGAEFAAILDRFGAPTEETWEDAEGSFGWEDTVQRYDARVRDWGVTDPGDRVRNHLPASELLTLPTNNDGLSW